jgi:hypothetical protein
MFGDMSPAYRQSTLEETIRGDGPELPPGWMQLVDGASNRHFYHHKATGRTVFNYGEIWKTPPRPHQDPMKKLRATRQRRGVVEQTTSPQDVTPVRRRDYDDVPEVSTFATTPTTETPTTVDLSCFQDDESAARFETRPPVRFRALGVPLRIDLSLENEAPELSQMRTNGAKDGDESSDDGGPPPLMKRPKYSCDSDSEDESVDGEAEHPTN